MFHVSVSALSPDRKDETKAISSQNKANIQRCRDKLKSFLEYTTKDLSQGTKVDGSKTPLHKIYTELYIRQGGSGEVNSEHEVVNLECKRSSSEDEKIQVNDILQPLSNKENPPQRVLTKGISGIGKSVAVQKFTHDWATGKANKTIDFIFPFTFRDLNLIKDKDWSLVTLIGHYFDEVKDLKESDYSESSVLFIFDGLDESQLPLDFNNNEMFRDVTKTTTLDVLLTNLTSGKLLHKASVWITSRPAAAAKIPPEIFHRVTEVRGFNDEQKEEYFQKKVSDKDMAQKIIDHLQSKTQRSLYIMCHIPVFCWISATALQSLLTETEEAELPKTVTEMYTHFLIIQTKLKEYQEGETDKYVIIKLGKLAFEQLQKGNILFYENEFKTCGIDLKQAAVNSGVCTQIIRKESGLHKQEIYSFIHLSVQEFLAALYVLETFLDSGENLLSWQTRVEVPSEKGERAIFLLHQNAVDMALVSDNGQWDLFLRFLLGLSQDKNQELLQERVGFKGRRPQSNQETIKFIHEKIKKLSNSEKSINLFHCLNELGDQSLVEQVQKYQSSGDFVKLLPEHWSALAFQLLVSNEDLDVFDLEKYEGSEEVLERLLPVLKASKKASLSNCNLTDRCCENISSVLSSKSSGLEELDMSGNNLLDSGVKLLSDGLKSPNCKLQRLCLNSCRLTAACCKSLTFALSDSSDLRELNLSYNYLKDQGVELLSDWLRKPQCKLEILSLRSCWLTAASCRTLTSVLSDSSDLRQLNLSNNNLKDQGVGLLSDWLQKPQCRLEILKLRSCMLSADSCKSLTFRDSSDLRELNLSHNNLEDQGVELLSDWLRKPQCRLEILKLSSCMLTGRCCENISSVLISKSSGLEELDLSGNNLLDSGVELLSHGLKSPNCKLQRLHLKNCMLTAASCRSLSLAFSKSSDLKELNLSYNKLEVQGVKLLTDWLRKTQCRLEILRLSFCTESCCESLASALESNPSHLRELTLDYSDPGESGLKLLSDLQENKAYKLQTLRVSKGYIQRDQN
ncbi:NACHT, LRR and PYD domains-containing protein 3-like isoform X2 [Perca flavescens]|uniref:NACHT, LRR and PYD domains-containing protein 3-like isoform X2 n=1 Tax=Perca flavescens TaxID=8167 RepID=UPI00106E0A0C|nr:NACHT, LRR and PYD domains-containing protein 3-like isoform X2 [Perca flavescens]XP_028420829.1 NACHT, LRR and PYD domains-containing protein 3-like isoform X2 [Perca flavescens]